MVESIPRAIAEDVQVQSETVSGAYQGGPGLGRLLQLGKELKERLEVRNRVVRAAGAECTRDLPLAPQQVDLDLQPLHLRRVGPLHVPPRAPPTAVCQVIRIGFVTRGGRGGGGRMPLGWRGVPTRCDGSRIVGIGIVRPWAVQSGWLGAAVPRLVEHPGASSAQTVQTGSDGCDGSGRRGVEGGRA